MFLHAGAYTTGNNFMEDVLVASRLLTIRERRDPGQYTPGKIFYQVKITEKGRMFVEAWKKGDQAAAIGLGGAVDK